MLRRYYWTEDGMEPDNVNGGWVRADQIAGVLEALTESAKQHRQRGDTGHAAMCDLFASRLNGGAPHCRVEQVPLTDEQRKLLTVTREVSISSTHGVGEVHTDHPLRHYDRTCPACNAEPTFSAADVEEAAKHCGISDGHRDLLAHALRDMHARGVAPSQAPLWFLRTRNTTGEWGKWVECDAETVEDIRKNVTMPIYEARQFVPYGVTTGAAAQLGPSTAADEWRAPAAGVPTGFAPQPAAWANESGLERIEKARTGYVESPLLTVNAKQTDLFTVPLYRHPPYGVTAYTCLSVTADGRLCRSWCGDPKCAAGVNGGAK